MNTNSLLIYYLLSINAVTFALYGIGKLKSKKGWWRISEKTLLMLAVLGGSMGCFVRNTIAPSQDKAWEVLFGCANMIGFTYCFDLLFPIHIELYYMFTVLL